VDKKKRNCIEMKESEEAGMDGEVLKASLIIALQGYLQVVN
jgi:hypothetical protein